MKTVLLLISIVGTLTSNGILASEKEYKVRVDGLACPYCAYGIEKKLVNTIGVTSVEFDIVNGLVLVKTEKNVTMSHDKMKQLINESGFTMKSMEETMEENTR